MSYISELQIDNGSIIPIASSLYGISNTAAATGAKEIASGSLLNFDTWIPGTTIHVKFSNGNSAKTGLSLTIGTMTATISVPSAMYNWPVGGVISFTLDGTTAPYTWIANDSDSGNEITIQHEYISNSQDAISGQGVADALDELGDAADKGVITNINSTNKNSADLPTTEAITRYVDDKTTGLTGAMHFKGTTTTVMEDGRTTATVVIGGENYTPEPGDVVLYNSQEYVWAETNSSTHAGYWELLGDEGSYLLQSAVQSVSVINSINFSAGTLPTVTLDQSATTVMTGVSNGEAAKATTASVNSGVLKITTGVLQQFNTGSVRGVANVSQGTAPTLTPGTTNALQIISN